MSFLISLLHSSFPDMVAFLPKKKILIIIWCCPSPPCTSSSANCHCFLISSQLICTWISQINCFPFFLSLVKAANQSRSQCLQHLIWQHPLIYHYILLIYLLLSHFSRTSKLLHSRLWGSLFNCKFKKHKCQRLFNYGTEPNKNNYSLHYNE